MLVLGAFGIPLPPYAAIPAVASLPVPSGGKAALSAALVIAAEGTFLLSAFVLGREAVRRYSNVRTWFGWSARG